MPGPVVWGEGREESFRQWITWELQQALGNRGSLETQWTNALAQYRAPIDNAIKSFPWEGAPLARDTQVLTTAGFRRVDSLRLGEIVLTRRDHDSALEWHPITALPQVYAPTLMHFKSRGMDLLVTPEHAMVVEAQNSGRVSRIPARNLWGKTGYYLPQRGQWHGRSPEKLFGLPAKAVAELVGWYLAEGSLTNSGSVLIAQSRSANPEKCRRIESVLTTLKLGWSYAGTTFIVHKRTMPVALWTMLAAQRGAEHKRVPPMFFELSPEIIESLLAGMILGDGCVFEREDRPTPKVHYYTTSRHLADDVQVLALLNGMHARVRQRTRVGAGGVIGERQIQGQATSYEVTFCFSARAKYDRAFFAETVAYHDVAFCVTVANHAIYVRRNGVACWTGNSNRTLPITAMNVDPLLARFLTTLHAPGNLWTLQALNDRWVNVVKPLQDYLQYLDDSTLKMFSVNYRAMLEFVKLGTCIYKTGWFYEKRKGQSYDATGRIVPSTKIVSRPYVDFVSLQDFVIPGGYDNIQADDYRGAPWVGERFWLRYPDFLARAQGQEPFLPAYDPKKVAIIKNYLQVSRTKMEQERDQLENNPPWRMYRIELFEIHARYGVKSDSDIDDIVAVVHLPTRTVLRTVLNPYRHGMRPYECARYIRGDGFYGIGVAEQSQMFQDWLSTLVNYQTDNVLAANATMIATKNGSNVVPGEPIYPGKNFSLDNPREDIVPIKLADIYQSLPQLAGIAQAWGERRTGLSDLQFGNMNNMPSRTPATSMLSLLQEGNRRFDLSLKELRANCLDRVGLRVLQMLQQFAADPVIDPSKKYLRLAATVLGDQPGKWLSQILELPIEEIENGIGCAVSATSGMANKEVEKQSFLALVQLQAQLSPQYLQLAQIADNPQIMQSAPGVANTAKELFRGFAELQKRLLEQYDVRNPEDILVDAQTLESANSSIANGQPIVPGGGTGGAVGASPLGLNSPQAVMQPAGMGQLLGLAGAPV